MPHLDEVVSGHQRSGDARVEAKAAVVVFLDQGGGAVGPEQLHVDVGLADCVDHVHTVLVRTEAIQVLLAGLADRSLEARCTDSQRHSARQAGLALRVHLGAGDELLVHAREHIVGVCRDVVERPLRRKGIEHDRVGVELGAIDAVHRVLEEHVVPRGRRVPEVGRAGQRFQHDGLVPLNPAGGAGVLVRQADGVAELVRSRTAVEKTQVHRGLIGRHGARVGADVRPGPVVLVECNANFGVRSVAEIELEVGYGRPPRRLLARGSLLGRRATHEPHSQRGAVDPALPLGCKGTHPAAGASCRFTGAQQITREDAVEAAFRCGHGELLFRDRTVGNSNARVMGTTAPVMKRIA